MLRSSLRLLASPPSFALSTEGPGVSASTQPREDVSPAAGRTVPMKAIKFGGKGGGGGCEGEHRELPTHLPKYKGTKQKFLVTFRSFGQGIKSKSSTVPVRTRRTV